MWGDQHCVAYWIVQTPECISNVFDRMAMAIGEALGQRTDMVECDFEPPSEAILHGAACAP